MGSVPRVRAQLSYTGAAGALLVERLKPATSTVVAGAEGFGPLAHWPTTRGCTA